jgi:uncharacterized membrane-anchored protein YitT (DUF2179 family)
MKTIKNINIAKLVKELTIMMFAMLITAVAVHFFLKPSGLIIGSISGLSIVIEKLSGVPISIVTFIINSILLVLANILIGKEFGVKTIFTSLLLSPYLAIFEIFFPIQQSIMQDPWLDLICFVLTLGFAQAILFKINASTGGLDIMAKIINKFFHIEIGTAITFAGAMICLTAFLISDLRIVIIGLIGTYVNGLIVDNFATGFNTKKRACIISEQYKEIQNFIIKDLNRGATLYNVTGGYKSDQYVELETLLTRSEFSKLMGFIYKNNYKAFITAGNVSEIYGLWHDNKKLKKSLNS